MTVAGQLLLRLIGRQLLHGVCPVSATVLYCTVLAAYFCTECVRCQLVVEIQEQARKQPVMQQPVMMGQQMLTMMPR